MPLQKEFDKLLGMACPANENQSPKKKRKFNSSFVAGAVLIGLAMLFFSPHVSTRGSFLGIGNTVNNTYYIQSGEVKSDIKKVATIK